MDIATIAACFTIYLFLAVTVGTLVAVALTSNMVDLIPDTDLNKITIGFFWPIVIAFLIIRYFILMVLNLFKVIFKILTIKDKKDN